MTISEDIESFEEEVDDLYCSIKLLYGRLKKLEGEDVDKVFISKGMKCIRRESANFKELEMVYNDFVKQINKICDQYVNDVNEIEKNGNDAVEELKKEFEKVKEEMEVNSNIMKNTSLYDEKELSFVFRGNRVSKINVELVKKYPGSYFYKEYMNGNRTKNGDVFIDHDGKNDELIVKYMKDDNSLIEDMKKMNNEERSRFFKDLTFLNLPIKENIMKELGRNEDNEKMEAWRERRVVKVNGSKTDTFNELLNDLCNHIMNNEVLNIQYDKNSKSCHINLNMKYYDVIEDYLKNGRKMNSKMIKEYNQNEIDGLMNEMKMIGIELSEEEKELILFLFQSSNFLCETHIVEKKFDVKLREWLGNDGKWKLIYRASEHEYSGESFHEYCDDKGPTLIVIKSSGGWIFGGYTTKSWSGRGMIYDMIY